MKTNFITHGNQEFPTINTNLFEDWVKSHLDDVQLSLNSPAD